MSISFKRKQYTEITSEAGVHFCASELYDILNCLNKLTGVIVALYDNTNNEIVYNAPVMRGYCQYLQSSEKGAIECPHLDQCACTISATTHKTYTYICHAGLCETLIPLYLNSVHIGYLVLGQYRNASKAMDHKEVVQVAKKCGVDPDTLCALYNDLSIYTDDEVENYTKLLSIIADSIIARKLVKLSNVTLFDIISQYIDEHLSEELTSSTLCAQFYISRSNLFSIFKQANTSPNNYITDKRLQTAYKLIIETQLSVAEICEKIGFSNSSYFCRQFRARFGTTPIQTRKQYNAQR